MPLNKVRPHLNFSFLHSVFKITLLLMLFEVIYASDLEDDRGSVDSSDLLSEEFKKEAPIFPVEYTLMLLDRSRIDWETISSSNPDPVWSFIAPQVREMKNRNYYFSYQFVNSVPQYYACKLMRNWSEVRAENLIDSLLGSSRAKRDSFKRDAEQLVFLSSMILFPIDNSSDRVLAYLFGRWPSLLNVDTIVKNFGLRSAVSVGVFCDQVDVANKELRIINEVIYEDCRIDDPMNTRLRSRRGLHLFDHFRLSAGDSRIEGIRFKPTRTWGRAYITASDSFQFRLSESTDMVIETLYKKARNIYTSFQQSTDQRIYTSFFPYIDIPLAQEIADQLKQGFIGKWSKYFKRKEDERTVENEDSEIDIVYPHWTYWFRTRNALNKGEIPNLKLEVQQYVKVLLLWKRIIII